ncbi:MAG: UDP-N-acetylenolpyruvoylglucosamine reductase [Bacteroidetes bacterium RBG_13_43_22]|nr:MAG: UDP-N-acetylenolpyruvoylglucosamine reductase [Bacteroidetes bacterium RBG_13_43_22]
MIYKNLSLELYNTFGLDYRADLFISVGSEEEAIKLFKFKNEITEPVFILGGGSNLLFVSDFNGTIIHPSFEGINIEQETADYSIVSAGAGVVWDSFIAWAVDHGFGGIENLSLIPGLVGATPVQNIGAYGAEVRDTIIKVRGINLENGTIKEFSNDECRFRYRDSIFKRELRGEYLITNVFFRLSKRPEFRVNYGSLKPEAEKLGPLSLKTIRAAVINIRRGKLPDPEIIGNAGSFFKNPVVSREKSELLKIKYPGMPAFDDASGEIKLAAGWLIEQCGWKGKRIGDAGVHEKQSLVIVNHGNATGKEIYDLSEKIRISVLGKFGVSLEREVEVVGTI